MPLPPSISLAHATVSRHLDVQNAFDKAACASLSFPSSNNCAWRTSRHCDAVMFSIIRARRSWISWNDPIGFPNWRRSCAYFSEASYRPHAHPGDIQPTAYRVIFKTFAVSRKELPPCRRFASGTRTSFNVMWPFCTTLSATLFSIFSTVKPGVVLFSTMNPLTWLSSTSRAQTIEMSHHVELPIHFFSPLRIQVSPSRFAVVRSPPDAPEPTSGSVRAKQPILLNRAIGGSHFCFCSSDPSI